MRAIIMPMTLYCKGSLKMNRTKQITITIRVSAELKAMVVKQAKAQNRTMVSYLEWLVLQDAAQTEPKKRRG